jgi:arsenite oxidase small subunit
MSDKVAVSRRTFLKVGGSTVAAGAATVLASGKATAAATESSRTLLAYPRAIVGKATTMATNTAAPFNYPDASSPCVAIKLGSPVAGGVGPEHDIVGYSTMCTHMGCPVVYDANAKTFKCPCHYSMFDAEKSGQMICGQATENLPRVLLEYDTKTGAVTAIGIDGLIYGRQSNIL